MNQQAAFGSLHRVRRRQNPALQYNHGAYRQFALFQPDPRHFQGFAHELFVFLYHLSLV